MRFLSVLAFLVLFYSTGQAQTNPEKLFVDSAIAKAITVSGLCLCQTSLPDLQRLCPDLTEVAVEEMDLPTKCFGQDTRFENGKGYYSSKYPGMIFQKDRDTDYISKIRLTKDFKGNLPNGASVNLQNLTLNDVFQIYPELKGKWGSRDCSEYWNISNDTIAFFVKINPDKKPQFPVDEAYYGQKSVEAIDIKISCLSISMKKNGLKKALSNDPLFFIDSVNVEKSELMKLKPADVATLTVLKNESATKLLGPKGAGGAIFIETKNFARTRYWNFFKIKSPEYAKAVPDPEGDSSAAYILNGKVLQKDFEGALSQIDDKTFIDLKLIDKDDLEKDYGITDKTFGVSIRANIGRKESRVQPKN